MQTQNRILDDLARMASGAVGALGGVKGEVEALFRQQFERLFRDMDIVARDEFDAVREMAATARAEQESLSAKLDALLSGSGGGVVSGGGKKATPRRTAAARLRRAARKKRAK
ncbi:MAG: accessory factor UbiK family protein [Alphaproteobacteria bacterium]|nr:accessory factor UbiK family protein [Alphaproteobacteria bacterium]